MQTRQIPLVSREQFEQLARQNPNLLHEQPWIVSGYTQDWPEYRQWQDLDYLRQRFGDLKAFAKAPNFITNRNSSLVSVETRFGQYLDYIEHPERVEAIYEGCWMEGDHAAYLAQNLPLYCGTLRIVHQADDPVFDALHPLVPEPIETWNHALPYYYSLFNHLWLLVSLPGALTPLHTDNNGTIALIAQLRGRKRATLYSPADLRHVRNPEVGFMDPHRPDPVDFPSWDEAVKWTGDLDVGQTLFVGTNWAHHVETLDATSISVSFDFVDQSNLAAYASSAGWAEAFGNRIKRNPALVVDKLRGAISLAEIESRSAVEVGRRVMARVLRAAIGDAKTADLAPIRERYLAHLDACLEQPDELAA
ncbi:MAG: cupin-like domain-containing protein [Lysobacter sp.]